MKRFLVKTLVAGVVVGVAACSAPRKTVSATQPVSPQASPQGSGLKTTRIEDLSPEKRKKALWQLEQVNSLRAYKRGLGSKEGALKEVSELAMCSVFFEMMGKTGAKGSGRKQQKTNEKFLLFADRADRTGVFFAKKYFKKPELLVAIGKNESAKAIGKLDLSTARDKAMLDGVRDGCVKKGTLMGIVRLDLEKESRRQKSQ